MVQITKRKGPPVRGNYDRRADVLYLSLGSPKGAESELIDGLLFRYGEGDSRPCGVTVIGFLSNKWDAQLNALVRKIADHLAVTPAEVKDAITHLLGSNSRHAS